MKSAVVSDTSPLNYLVWIEAVEILPRLFSEVVVPPAVIAELSQPGTPDKVRHWLTAPPAWLKKRSPQHTSPLLGLDAGETEAIFLAHELKIEELLIDERKGRQVAADRGLTVIGTLGLLEVASAHGWIDFDEHIRRLRATPFRIHERLIVEAKQRLRSRTT